MKFKVGDSVIVISGKDRGKKGTLSRISKSKDRVVIEGINRSVKHVKGRDGNPGERVEFFATIHISNIAIIDSESKKPSRIGYSVDSAGKKIRISKKSGKEVVSPALKGKKTIKA